MKNEISIYKQRFYSLMESKLGNVKPLINEQPPVGNIIGTLADAGFTYGQNFDNKSNECEIEKKDYEIVVDYINWCRYNESSDKTADQNNPTFIEVKKDVETTSTEDLITPAISKCKNAQDFCKFVNSYYKYKGDLYNDLDKSVIMYDKWNRIIDAIQPKVKEVIVVKNCKKYKKGQMT